MVACLATTLFFGGWQVPYLMPDGFHFPSANEVDQWAVFRLADKMIRACDAGQHIRERREVARPLRVELVERVCAQGPGLNCTDLPTWHVGAGGDAGTTCAPCWVMTHLRGAADCRPSDRPSSCAAGFPNSRRRNLHVHRRGAQHIDRRGPGQGTPPGRHIARRANEPESHGNDEDGLDINPPGSGGCSGLHP